MCTSGEAGILDRGTARTRRESVEQKMSICTSAPDGLLQRQWCGRQAGSPTGLPFLLQHQCWINELSQNKKSLFKVSPKQCSMCGQESKMEQYSLRNRRTSSIKVNTKVMVEQWGGSELLSSIFPTNKSDDWWTWTQVALRLRRNDRGFRFLLLMDVVGGIMDRGCLNNTVCLWCLRRFTCHCIKKCCQNISLNCREGRFVWAYSGLLQKSHFQFRQQRPPGAKEGTMEKFTIFVNLPRLLSALLWLNFNALWLCTEEDLCSVGPELY